MQCRLCKEWWHEECSSYEGSEHLYVTTAKFSGYVPLASRPAYSYPPRRPDNRWPRLQYVTVKSGSWTVGLQDTLVSKEYGIWRLTVMNYQGSQVFLLCFSVVSPSSFESVRTTWLPEITERRPKTPYFLVGTQTDLRDDKTTVEMLALSNERPITFEEGTKMSKELGAVKYLECSVLTQEGLEELMEEVVLAFLKKKKKFKCVIL
ncbi:Cdc42 [Araneus ventricosus]|uniref:Cdc42 n=1 Tax=Araneus ventricosus TaxID=182803 RepID=A0A4Y2B420_ARAVE|nr:Cdc42 [Araneus ventricosus]